MRIVVCIKQVAHPNSVYVDPLTGAVDEESILYVSNPADTCAVEEAVRIKELLGEGEVIAVSLGPPRAEKVLRDAIALGADRILRVWDDVFARAGGYAVALALARAVQGIGYDLVLCGARSADFGSGVVGPYLAELLNLPYVLGVTRIQLASDMGKAVVSRKLAMGAREVVECPFPALLAVEASLNEPRYPSLPALLKALRSAIPHVGLRELGFSRQFRWPSVSPAAVGTSPPRPRPRDLFTPPEAAPAFERIGLIVSGGVVRRGSLILDGPAEEVVDGMLKFLADRGILFG